MVSVYYLNIRRLKRFLAHYNNHPIDFLSFRWFSIPFNAPNLFPTLEVLYMYLSIGCGRDYSEIYLWLRCWLWHDWEEPVIKCHEGPASILVAWSWWRHLVHTALMPHGRYGAHTVWAPRSDDGWNVWTDLIVCDKFKAFSVPLTNRLVCIVLIIHSRFKIQDCLLSELKIQKFAFHWHN